MTLTKRIIPCLDVKNGRVVKGLNFESIKDAGDPVELAKKYSNEGADELVFLDITASDEQRKTLKDLVRKVASVIDIPFTVGGGVKSLEDARNILLNGADKVGINTGAIKNPKVITELMKLFGRQCVVIAVDAKRNYNIDDSKNVFTENDKQFWFEVFIYGGKESTGIDVIQWVKDTEGRFSSNPLWGDGWGWALFNADQPDKTVTKNYKTECLGCHIPARNDDWIYLSGYPLLTD